jgi:hypothetical protein
MFMRVSLETGAGRAPIDQNALNASVSRASAPMIVKVSPSIIPKANKDARFTAASSI